MDINVTGFITAPGGKGKARLSPMKASLQSLEHHKMQYLELHRDLSKIEYAQQTEAALQNFKTLLLLEINMASHLRQDPGCTARCANRCVSVYLIHTGWRIFDFLLLSSQIFYAGDCRQEDANFEEEYCSFDRRHFLEYAVQDGDKGREGCTDYTCYTNYYCYTNYVSFIILIILVVFCFKYNIFIKYNAFFISIIKAVHDYPHYVYQTYKTCYTLIAIVHILSIITIMSFLQLHVDLGIADHVWQEKRNYIAKTVNS